MRSRPIHAVDAGRGEIEIELLRLDDRWPPRPLGSTTPRQSPLLIGQSVMARSPTRLMPTPASPHERPSARSRWSWTRRRTRHTRDERHANEHARHTLDPRPPNEHARSLKPRRAQAQLSVPSHVSHGANHCCSDHPKRDPVPTSSAACPCSRLCTSPVAPVGQRWLGSSVGPSHLAVSADEPLDQRDTADRGRGGRAAEARRRRPALTLR